MEFSASLLAKALGGLAVASTITTVGIVKGDSIVSALGLKSSPQEEEEVNVKSEVNKKLIEYLKTTGKDITFKAYTGETGETPLGNDFPNFNNGNPITIRFAISTKTTSSLKDDSSNTKANELKTLLGTQTTEDLIWECKIKFNKSGTGSTWKTEEKEIFYKDNTGFYQKITKERNKLFKERFIKKCGELTSSHQTGQPIKLEKTFTLNGDSDLTIQTSDQIDFKSLFGEMELATQEVNSIKNTWNFSSDNNSNVLTLSDIGTGDEKIDGCKVTLTGNDASTKLNDTLNALKGKFDDANSINKEKYREGFLKKCRNNENSLSLETSNNNVNEKIKELFDFSREEAKQIYKDLKDVDAWSVSSAINDSKTEITVSATITKDSQTYTCKIIGEKADADGTKMGTAETELTDAIKGKVGSKTNNETNRTNLLKKCGTAFGEELKYQLKDKESNSYEFNDLNSIFA